MASRVNVRVYTLRLTVEVKVVLGLESTNPDSYVSKIESNGPHDSSKDIVRV